MIKPAWQQVNAQEITSGWTSGVGEEGFSSQFLVGMYDRVLQKPDPISDQNM